ncbi:MAG: sigma-70 family RNA polymerase sigma factor [Oscillatoriales cyanobacterium]|nr:MAG: sigma-70 family RNA polymerase sigma factor [Oscillatoriales cyanobacterium]
MNELIRAIERSNQLWYQASDIYDDAKQKTWFYLAQNLCEAVTAKKPFDPTIASITTWLNAYLKRRLQDLQIEQQEERRRQISLTPQGGQIQADSLVLDSNSWVQLAAQPDIPPILEIVTAWAIADEDGILRTLHVADRPDITAQKLILRRLPPEKSWQAIGEEFDYSWQHLTNFYHHHCRKQLRQFGIRQGWLDD